MDIHAASRSYEAWLGRHVPVRAADLRLKHARMRASQFLFLRGTFYRWLQLWPSTCAGLIDAPSVLAVGDLHVENFGTWRDAEGRLAWGVNDVDEACTLPYTNDLVRLATSALLAVDAQQLGVSRKPACAAILDGYTQSLESRGSPVVLSARPRWLRAIAVERLKQAADFGTSLTALPPAPHGAPEQMLRDGFPERGLRCHFVRRVAGVGSLGRPRFVAWAEWRGGVIAREAKALVPSAAHWLAERAGNTRDGRTILARAVRAPDPCFRVRAGWVLRRLAADCRGVDLATLPRDRDEVKLLHAMGWETANLHLGSARDAILRDLRRRRDGWLPDAADAMKHAVVRDWRDWQ